MNFMIKYTALEIIGIIVTTTGTLAGFVGRMLAYGLIWFYRLIIKPLFPATCRFEPSCSEYALQAVHSFGVLKGIWLAACRLARCNPWGPCGHDPIPEHRPSLKSIRLRREHP
jgi:putative membrane protein insertion efficiency factor